MTPDKKHDYIELCDTYEERFKTVRIRTFSELNKKFFSINDVLAFCGVKAPHKWMKNNPDYVPQEALRRVAFPEITGAGMRRYYLTFVDSDCVAKLANMLFHSGRTEAKKWLLSITESKPAFETDSVQFDVVQQSVAANKTKNADPNAEKNIQEINRKLDSILAMVIETKVAIMMASR